MRKLINYIKENKVSTLFTIILTILTIFFQPLIEKLRDLIIDGLLSLSQAFSNIYYRDIAKSDPNVYDVFSSLYISFITCITVLAITYFQIKKIHDTRRGLHSLKNRIINIKEKFTITNQKVLSEELELADINDMDSRIENLFTEVKKDLNRAKVGFIFVIVFLIMIVYSQMYSSSIADEILTFNNKMRVIKPKISSQTYDSLMAKWTLMENSNDFKIIHKEIDELNK